MEQRTVNVNDLSVTVYEGGSGTPLVWLHGAGGVTGADPLVVALAQRFRVIAPVHPGFNDLEELDELRDVHDLALYHDDLLDALGLDAVAVAGHSFGAMVAAELAAHVPSRVSKLILCAPLGLWNDDYPVADLFTAFPFEMAELIWADAASPAAMAYMTATAAAPATDAGAAPSGQEEDVMTQMLLRILPGLTTVGKYIWPIPDKGLARRLHRIKAQTLVIFGEKDKLVPSRYGDDFVAAITGARLEVLPDAGHMVPWEKQDDVLRLVTQTAA